MQTLMNERLDAMQRAIDAFVANLSTSTLAATQPPERFLPELLVADEGVSEALRVCEYAF